MHKEIDKEMDNRITAYLAGHRDEMVEDLKRLVSFASVYREGSKYPFGDENAAALDFMMELCEKSGLTTRNFDYYCMDASYGTGQESVAALCHLDMVPEGDGWKTPPFEATIRDGILYGRGVVDDKGPSIAALYALKALLASGVPLKRTVRLIFGCDEERGMSDLAYYTSKTGAPDYAFSPDAEFPVINAEKSILHFTYAYQIKSPSSVVKISAGTRANVIPPTASAQLDFVPSAEVMNNIVVEADASGIFAKAFGKAGHASKPESGDNAIIRLLQYLSAALPADDGLHGAVKKLYDALRFTDGYGLGIGCSDKASGALTCNLGILEFDGRELRATIDIRHPVTLEMNDTIAKLEKAIDRFSYTTLKAAEGLYWPESHPLVAKLMGVYRAVTGDRTGPASMGGGTYARALPTAVAFGPVLRGGVSGGEHTADERLGIDELLTAARIYAHSFCELANM